MEMQEFTGWVEMVFPSDQYSVEIAVANYNGENEKAKMLQDFKDKKIKDYPCAIRFKASVKSGAAEQLVGIEVGDKVKVKFGISGKSGISKKTGSYYCINELNICKKDGVVLVQKGAGGDSASSDDSLDIPF